MSRGNQHDTDSEDFARRVMRPAGPGENAHRADVDRLLARMTPKEKVGQMTQLTLQMICDGQDEALHINPEKLRKAVVEYGVGSMLNVCLSAMPAERWRATLQSIQTESQKTRLQIPVLYGIDTIHGANYVAEGTLFPQPLGMAATRSPELLLRASQIAAAETRKAGIPWTFSPILDVGRQPLWSRLYETFGEDPYLATVMGIASVRGYEGDDISRPNRVAACMKHYVGYSFPASGRDRTTALIPENMLREYFLPTFAAAVKAGAHTLMVNSGDVNGIPGHVNHYLLTTVLRHELGFAGLVVSDWQDIKRLVDPHRVAETEKEATRLAIMAGIDMSMVPDAYSFSDLLLELVLDGAVPMSRIDEAVGRILHLKYALGLFDDALRGTAGATSIGDPKARRVSRQAAEESITLLKNDHLTLPIPKRAKVLLTGPTANSLVSLNNGWSYTWTGDAERMYPKDCPTILEAMQAKLGADHVTYVAGAEYDVEIDVVRAAEAARDADIAVVCLGERSYAEASGIISSLDLPSAQLCLAEQVLASGKPVVLILVEGRPRIIRTIADAAAAILMAYNPGNEGGRAIADVLLGDVNPSGKLPITYPRWANALHAYDELPEGVVDTGNEWSAAPQFPFGHGLSYTRFEYSALELVPRASDGGTHVAVTVKNVGDRAGKEVVELYVVDRVGGVKPPSKRLKRFAKVSLHPGESRRIAFRLGENDFSFVGPHNRRVLEPGTFEVEVGGLTASFELA